MGFSDLKKSSKDANALIEKITKLSQSESTSYVDERYWKPERDKADNGLAIIRFLPPVENEDQPWVRLFSHGFKGPNGWVIENCPTTIGKKCPICEANGLLWNSGSEIDKELARSRKRRLQYISNVYVISDPMNPDNEGKVFLYKYGKKIHDKIMESLQPEFSDEEAVNPFDFWSGADFRIKIRKDGNFVSYDKSTFDSPSAFLDGDDEKLEAVWKQQYPLQSVIADDQFKSYDELKEKFEFAVNGKSKDIGSSVSSRPSSPTPESASVNESAKDNPPSDSTGQDLDAMSYFEKLAGEDD